LQGDKILLNFDILKDTATMIEEQGDKTGTFKPKGSCKFKI
jgi:hypothetical protein